MLKKIFFIIFLSSLFFILYPFPIHAAIEQGRLDTSPSQIYKDTTSINSLTITCTAFASRKGATVRIIYPNSTEDLVTPQNNQITINGDKLQGQIGQPGTYTFVFKDTVGAQNTLCQAQYNISSMTAAEAAAAQAAPAGPNPCKANQLETALGCIPTQPAPFIAWIFGWALGLAGGIAFLLLIWGAVQVILSSGDPEKLAGGKDIITSALIGLTFIIFTYLKRWYSYLIFMVLAFIAPTLTGTFSSLPRYALVLFPSFILLSLWAEKYRWIKILYPLLAIPLLIFCLILFTRGYWVA